MSPFNHGGSIATEDGSLFQGRFSEGLQSLTDLGQDIKLVISKKLFPESFDFLKMRTMDHPLFGAAFLCSVVAAGEKPHSMIGSSIGITLFESEVDFLMLYGIICHVPKLGK